MELREPIEKINYWLEREFGRALDGRPNFRVVFSDDQYEKRWTKYTDEGLELLFPEVRELPKYRQYIHSRYLLERLIPIVGETDLVENTSYECCWVFQDSHGNYLPPFFEGCKFVIETLHAQMSKKGLYKKYTDPNEDPEYKNNKIKEMKDLLFGNETETGDSLAYKEAIVVPRNYDSQDLKGD